MLRSASRPKHRPITAKNYILDPSDCPIFHELHADLLENRPSLRHTLTMSAKPKNTTPPAQESRRGLVAIVVAVLSLILGLMGYNLADFVGNNGQADPTTLSHDWYEIYFTNPTCPPEAERVGGIDERIAQEIAQAQIQVDIATFDLDSVPIIEALITAKKNGVLVRVAVDNENNPEATTNRLRRNGISVVEDKRSAFMHNKFVVIDGEVVWTGAMNFTTNDVFCNNNNTVRFQSYELAANYSTELNEMYQDRAFGPTSPANTVNEFNLNGVRVENYFSPEQEVAPILARLVARADSEILFMAFSYTHELIGEAVIERAERGVVVRGVMEKAGSETGESYFNDFRRAKLDNLQVLQDGNPRIMHHKVIIIDREIVVFGSFNFSKNANNDNDENVLIVYDPTFATYFIEEFETVWAEAESKRK